MRKALLMMLPLSLGCAAELYPNGYGYVSSPSVYVAPRPVYAPPVYVAPRPVYVAPRPVYVAPPPAVVVRGRHRHWF